MAVVHVLVNKLDAEMQELVDQATQNNNTDKPLIQKVLAEQASHRVTAC